MGEKVAQDTARAMIISPRCCAWKYTFCVNLDNNIIKCLHNNKSYLISESYERAYGFYSKATYKGSPLGPPRIDDLLKDIVRDQLTEPWREKSQAVIFR